MINIVKADSGETLCNLYNKALDKCSESTKVSNLILFGDFSIKEFDSEWVAMYKEEALKWQIKDSKELTFTHAEYFDKYEIEYNKTALEYLVQELKDKPDSNRACWSLFDMSTLLDSGDKSIPSFMILQVGISDCGSGLLVTAYYRALEISNFLPINLAELSLVIIEINKQFSFKIKTVSLVIHAFNGYVKDGFSCLKKANIDILESREIMHLVDKGKNSLPKLKELLKNKEAILESRIEQSGLTDLIESIKLYNSDIEPTNGTMFTYDEDILSSLECALNQINEYNDIVFRSSYSKRATEKYEEVKSSLRKAISTI